MEVSTLVVDPEVIRLDCIRPLKSAITLIERTTSTHAESHRCHRASSRVHSRYIRCVTDLSWQGVKLCHLFPQMEKAKELAQEFVRIVRERSSNKFNEWFRPAMHIEA